MLLSDTGGAGVGNSSGLVGRNLTFHFQTHRDRRVRGALHGHRGRTVDARLRRFPRHARRPESPARRHRRDQRRRGPDRRGGVLRSACSASLGVRRRRCFKRLMRQSPGRDRVGRAGDAGRGRAAADAIASTSIPRCAISTACRCARVTYANHAFELAARDFYAPKLLDILGAAGARYAAIAPRRRDSGVARTSWGRCASATTRRPACATPTAASTTSATSTPPTARCSRRRRGFNPTMTIVALATRVGAAMVSPGSPESALG